MTMHLATAVAIILTTIGVSSCTHTVYQTVPLPSLARPVLPPVSSDDLECLSDDTYNTLYQRENAILDYAEELEAVINAANREH